METSGRANDVGFEKFSVGIDGIVDPLMKYPDSFYESFIVEFKPDQEKCFFYCFFKRLFDIAVSAILLALLFPLMMLLAIAVRLDSKGPAIFIQNRVGKDGKVFRCYKFRSMKPMRQEIVPHQDWRIPNSIIPGSGAFFVAFLWTSCHNCGVCWSVRCPLWGIVRWF